MTKTRKGILLSNIKYNYMCISLSAPINFAYNNCEPKIDVHSKKGR